MVHLKKCTKVTAPAGVARDDRYGVVGGDGLIGEVFYACSPCDMPTMVEKDSQLLTDGDSSDESHFFEADPVAVRESRRLCAEARECKRAERALDEPPYMGGNHGKQSYTPFGAGAFEDQMADSAAA